MYNQPYAVTDGDADAKMKATHEAPLGVFGIRDVEVKNYRDTGCEGKLTGYGILTGYVTFRPKINGIRDTRTPTVKRSRN